MDSIRTPWRAVAALFTLAGALFGIWASRVPAVAEKHDLTPDTLGVFLLLMALGSTVAFPISGWAADRIGSTAVARRFALACTIALILVGLAPSQWTLALAIFAFGATLGGTDVAMNSWAVEVERTRSRPIMSSFHAMFSVGAGIGAATGYVAESAGADIPTHFAIAAIASGVAALWMAAIPWESTRRPRRDGAPAFAIPRGPLVIVALVAFCASIGEGGMADWSAIFLVEVATVSEAEAALGYTVFSIAMVAMRLIGDRVVARFGPVLVGRMSGILAASGIITAVAIGTFPAILAGFALMGIGYAMIMPVAFTRAANDGTMPQGAAIAAVATLGYGGVMIGPPLIGFVAGATSIRTAFLILGAFAILMTVLSGVLAPRQAERKAVS